MPDGYYVDDFTQKLRYKVGTPVGEYEAINNFMRSHGITGNVPLPQQHMTPLQYVLMGIGIVMILIALYSMLMKRLRS
jgi:hypothetical protein